MSNFGSYGEAGKGLHSDSAREKFGKNAGIGALGEKYLKSAIDRSPSVSQYAKWSSLNIPKAAGYGTDVDMALASGNNLILVDCKLWSAGKVYWSIFGRVMSGWEVKKDKYGQPEKLSQNMSMALNKYREALPGVNVSAIVIFVPNRSGKLPSSVFFMRWPGAIRSYLTNDGLMKIKKVLGKPETPSLKIQALVGRMTK